MNRIEHQNGLWSERDGAKLTYGRDDKQMSARFGREDRIADVPSGTQAAIRKAGKDPEKYCLAGSQIVPRALIHEIEACIAFALTAHEAEQATNHAALEAAIASGEAFRAVEIAAQYGCELTFARRLRDEEKSQYAEWCREIVMVVFSASPRIKVEWEAVKQVVGSRAPDGQFNGCENQVWSISAEEWDRIIVLSDVETRRKVEVRQRNDADQAADIQRKIDSGYCFSCESWCHGDCGSYRTHPDVQVRRELAHAVAEQQYGINEG